MNVDFQVTVPELSNDELLTEREPYAGAGQVYSSLGSGAEGVLCRMQYRGFGRKSEKSAERELG